MNFKTHAEICNDLYDRFLAARARLDAAESMPLVSIATIERLADEAGDAHHAFEIEMANDLSPSFVKPMDDADEHCPNCGGYDPTDSPPYKLFDYDCTCTGSQGCQS